MNFFNSAAGFSDTIYAGNTQDPHISYSLKPVASEGFQSVGLQLDGQTFTYSGGDAAAKQFKWQGTGPHEAKATVKFGGGPDLAWSDNDGLWAIFHFFDKAERWQPSGNGYTLEWVIRIGKDAVKLPSGAPLTAGAVPVGYEWRSAGVSEGVFRADGLRGYRGEVTELPKRPLKRWGGGGASLSYFAPRGWPSVFSRSGPRRNRLRSMRRTRSIYSAIQSCHHGRYSTRATATTFSIRFSLGCPRPFSESMS